MGSLTRTQTHGRLASPMAPDAFFAAHGWARVPRLVQWMVTRRCPLSCPHCLAAGDGAAGEELSLTQAARLIEQVAAMGAEELLLTGGEPLARPDLPALLHMIGVNGVRWSLNTAAMPDRLAQRAVEDWPPCFVAVSLDGPREVHDGFRGRAGAFGEAMASLAYFADIAGDGVAAGTTVTRRNFGHLPDTFGLVVGSGATSWGLHLVVPEGRARQRADLFLSRRQLKALLRFAAAKRGHFPVSMADEIGYCGSWEPLVRDEPFFCGAGKAQCVVLPDGEVVPCTTLDRSASSGNVLRTPLSEIWEHGFAALRQWRPEGECESCRYAAACQGGCWLQRRHGTQCFRRVWRVPRALTKAGMAVCLGLAASGLGRPAAAAEPPGMPGRPPLERPGRETRQMQILQSSIIRWYAAQVGGARAGTVEDAREGVAEALPDDPGAKYFLAFTSGERPDDVAARAEQIEAALGTRQRSLCLIGLAWRDLAEWCLDSAPPTQRTEGERQALRDALARLGTTAEAWRKEIFERKLDPFLRRPDDYRFFFRSKAGPPPDVRMASDVAVKRGWTRPDITEAFLARHPHAEGMTLSFEASDAARLRCLRAGREAASDGKLGVFDVLLVAPGADATPVKLTFATAAGKLEAALPPGSEWTYADMLRVVYETNRQAVEKLASMGWRPGRAGGVAALALPALREQLRELEAQGDAGRASPGRRTLLWRLVDLYLF